MSIQLIRNGNDLILLQADKIIGTYDLWSTSDLSLEVQEAILLALGFYRKADE